MDIWGGGENFLLITPGQEGDWIILEYYTIKKPCLTLSYKGLTFQMEEVIFGLSNLQVYFEHQNNMESSLYSTCI